MKQNLTWLLAAVGTLAACSEQETLTGPITDCQALADNTMICPQSFPGCTWQAKRSVQFVHCQHRYGYVVYGHAESCPDIYYYPEGSFLSPADWEAFVGPCDVRQTRE